MTTPPPPGLAIRVSTILIAALSVAVPALVVRYAPPVVPQLPRSVRVHRPPQRVVPPTVVPPVEPVELVDLSPDEARAYNADVPFSRGANPAARRFVLKDPAEDFARATDCLAAAVLYEAGDDAAGERAVAQVVLNRLRHPAFPKTVCGVVFEGQERKTGCQFTFSCDGAMTRWAPPAAMWTRARAIATAALTGAVYRPVGYATHYHTDWVVPYWQSSLDKIAAVKSHLFFRWSGWWGTPPAFNRRVDPAEPVIQQLAAFSDAHRLGDAVETAEAVSADAAALALALTAGVVAPPTTSGEPDSFLVALPANVSPDAYPQLADKACGNRDRCRFLGWTDAKIVPKTTALDPKQIASMAFSYLRDRPASLERTLWNCTLFPHTRPGGCMRIQPAAAATPVPNMAKTPQPAPTRGPSLLDGIRRPPAQPGAVPATAP